MTIFLITAGRKRDRARERERRVSFSQEEDILQQAVNTIHTLDRRRATYSSAIEQVKKNADSSAVATVDVVALARL